MPDVPDHALVVRGGDPHDPANRTRMRAQAQDSYDDGDGYALSVFVGVPHGGLSEDDIIVEIANAGTIPNRTLAVTTAAELRARGFNLIADGELPGHANVILGNLDTATAVTTFADAFRPARENPTWPAWRRPR